MTRFSTSAYLVILTVWTALAGVPLCAQPKADPLARTRATLDALGECLQGSGGGGVSWLKYSLLGGNSPGLRDNPPEPPPPEYLESLDRDLNTCNAALHLHDEYQRNAILESVRRDIAIKADDCKHNGMSRVIPVSIKTVRGSQTENGWQVFYKWICAGPLQPDEMRVPNLTSPANVNLPPGEYVFRAEKKNSSGQVQSIAPVQIVVSTVASVPLELAIQ